MITKDIKGYIGALGAMILFLIVYYGIYKKPKYFKDKLRYAIIGNTMCFSASLYALYSTVTKKGNFFVTFELFIWGLPILFVGLRESIKGVFETTNEDDKNYKLLKNGNDACKNIVPELIGFGILLHILFLVLFLNK